MHSHQNNSTIGGTVDDSQVEKCIENGNKLLPKCLYDNDQNQQYISSIQLSNVSSVIVGKDENSSSYICIDSTIQIEYLFMPPNMTSKLGKSKTRPKHKVL